MLVMHLVRVQRFIEVAVYRLSLVEKKRLKTQTLHQLKIDLAYRMHKKKEGQCIVFVYSCMFMYSTTNIWFLNDYRYY